MRTIALIITVLLLLLAAVFCWFWWGKSPWVKLSPSDPHLGTSIYVERDSAFKPNTARNQWNAWVVLQNTGPEPVHVAFRTVGGHIEYHSSVQVKASEMVALRVGPEDVEFLFRRTKPQHLLPLAPKQVDRVSTANLLKKYSAVPRL